MSTFLRKFIYRLAVGLLITNSTLVLPVAAQSSPGQRSFDFCEERELSPSACEEVQRNLNIYFMDNGGSSACGTTTPGTLVGSENSEKAFRYLTSKGLSAAQAAGIVGNLMQESGPTIDPAAANPNGKYKGIAQWDTASRWPALVAWVNSSSTDPFNNPLDFETQLEYLWLEATDRGNIDGIKAYNDVPHTTWYWGRFFEVAIIGGSTDKTPLTNVQHLDKRTAFAESVFAQFGGSVTGSTGGGSGCANGDVVGVATGYAWPDYRGRGYIVMKPEYEEAVNKARASGLYVGGTSYPGVDCGGFVTRVMLDSGHDPNYNHAGKGGFTGIQLEWVRSNWTKIGKVTSTSELNPGDVAFQVTSSGDNDGHTFMYVGSVPGFEEDIASASLDNRAPMAGRENPLDSNIEWYRKP